MQEYRPEDLKRDIEEIKESLKEHHLILRGEPGTSKPSGLIYDVSENSRFRTFALKLHWTLAVIVIGLVVNQVFELFKLIPHG